MSRKIVKMIKCPFCEYEAITKAYWTRHVKGHHHKPKEEILELKKEFGINDVVTENEHQNSQNGKKTKKYKYGASNYNNIKKAQKTLMDKHGVINVGQIPEVKEKVKKTTQERYGCDNVFQAEETKDKMKETYRNRYGVDYVGQIPEIQQKIRQSYRDHYGVDHAFSAQEVKDSIKKTMNERYGVDNPQQVPEIRERTLDTCEERYGYRYHLASSKIQQQITDTNQEKYGVNRAIELPEIKEKQKQTHFEKYGCWFAQTDEHHASNYQWKDYELPNGEIVQCQGYEHFALDLLFESHDIEDVIISTEEINNVIGKIWYNYNDEKHRYFPDIYIESTNTIVEVKSEYTYNVSKDINEAKKAACLEQEFNFEFWIFDNEGKRK